MSSTGGWKGRAVSDAVVATAAARASEGDFSGATVVEGVDRAVSERTGRRGVDRGTSVTATVAAGAGDVVTAAVASFDSTAPDSTDCATGA